MLIREEGISMPEAQNTLFVPQTIRIRCVAVKNYTTTKPSMYYTNCHHTNHNIETCKSKKEEPIVDVTKVTIQVSKPPRLINYPCHICGIVGHKLTNCPRFNEMQSMFKDKGNQSTKSKPTTKVKTITASINMVDVNVTIHNKTNEKQVFEDRKPRKNKFAASWEVEEKLKRSIMETIQQMQVVNLPLTTTKKGAYCDPNIIANNKEISFRKPAVPNNNSSQTLKPLRNPHLCTRTIASSSQLPKLNQSQNISNYNVFYT